MSEHPWYYADDDDEQYGPLSAADMKRLALSGELKPDYLVWREGMKDWAPARSLKGLIPSVKSQAGPRVATKTATAGSKASANAAKTSPAQKPAANSNDVVITVPEPTAPRSDAPQIGPPPGSDDEDEDDEEHDVYDEIPDVYADDEKEYEEDDDAPAAVRGAATSKPVYGGGGNAAAPASGSIVSLTIWAIAALVALGGGIVFALRWTGSADSALKRDAALLYLVTLAATYVGSFALDRISQSMTRR